MRRKQQQAPSVCSQHVLLLLLLLLLLLDCQLRRAAALQTPHLLQLPWRYQSPAKWQQVPQL
jgi:hypothetical protein